MNKIDISRAFRHIKVDPLDYDLLGLSWYHVYVNTCVAFGTTHGSQIFQHCSDAVCYIKHQNGHSIVGYIDDYVGFGVPSEAIVRWKLIKPSFVIQQMFFGCFGLS